MEASLESQFWPRLWEQRRTVVLSVLREHSALIDWVADLGCNTCGLASVLANSCDYAHISCVDLDPDMLAAAAVEPTEADLHQLRERPFIVDLFCGSIVGRDARLEGIDVVVLSEVIEHLDPGPLAALPRALFDFYRPKIVVVSTPNREFNVHFPNPRKVRDADHRFEWTRDEFKAWCDKAAADYGYTYTLTGCGTYPCCDRREHDDTGPATQFAVFMRPGATAELANKWPVAELTPPPPLLQHQRTQDSPWTFVRRVEYPWHKGPDLLPLFGPSSQSSNIDSQEDQGSLQQDLIEAVARALARAHAVLPLEQQQDEATHAISVADLWRLPLVRCAFRTLPLFAQFLGSLAAARMGLVVELVEADMADPLCLWRVEWGYAQGGYVQLLPDLWAEWKLAFEREEAEREAKYQQQEMWDNEENEPWDQGDMYPLEEGEFTAMSDDESPASRKVDV